MIANVKLLMIARKDDVVKVQNGIDTCQIFQAHAYAAGQHMGKAKLAGQWVPPL